MKTLSLKNRLKTVAKDIESRSKVLLKRIKKMTNLNTQHPSPSNLIATSLSGKKGILRCVTDIIKFHEETEDLVQCMEFNLDIIQKMIDFTESNPNDLNEVNENTELFQKISNLTSMLHHRIREAKFMIEGIGTHDVLHPVSKPEAKNLWRDNFKENDKILFYVSKQQYGLFLKRIFPTIERYPNLDDLVERSSFTGNKMISVYEYNFLVNLCVQIMYLPTVLTHVMGAPYFKPNITFASATSLLRNQSTGVFILRISHSQTVWVVCYVDSNLKFIQTKLAKSLPREMEGLLDDRKIKYAYGDKSRLDLAPLFKDFSPNIFQVGNGRYAVLGNSQEGLYCKTCNKQFVNKVRLEPCCHMICLPCLNLLQFVRTELCPVCFQYYPSFSYIEIITVENNQQYNDDYSGVTKYVNLEADNQANVKADTDSEHHKHEDIVPMLHIFLKTNEKSKDARMNNLKIERMADSYKDMLRSKGLAENWARNKSISTSKMNTLPMDDYAYSEAPMKGEMHNNRSNSYRNDKPLTASQNGRPLRPPEDIYKLFDDNYDDPQTAMYGNLGEKLTTEQRNDVYGDLNYDDPVPPVNRHDMYGHVDYKEANGTGLNDIYREFDPANQTSANFRPKTPEIYTTAINDAYDVPNLKKAQSDEENAGMYRKIDSDNFRLKQIGHNTDIYLDGSSFSPNRIPVQSGFNKNPTLESDFYDGNEPTGLIKVLEVKKSNNNNNQFKNNNSPEIYEDPSMPTRIPIVQRKEDDEELDFYRTLDDENYDDDESGIVEVKKQQFSPANMTSPSSMNSESTITVPKRSQVSYVGQEDFYEVPKRRNSRKKDDDFNFNGSHAIAGMTNINEKHSVSSNIKIQPRTRNQTSPQEARTNDVGVYDFEDVRLYNNTKENNRNDNYRNEAKNNNDNINHHSDEMDIYGLIDDADENSNNNVRNTNDYLNMNVGNNNINNNRMKFDESPNLPNQFNIKRKRRVADYNMDIYDS